MKIKRNRRAYVGMQAKLVSMQKEIEGSCDLTMKINEA